MVTQIGPYVLEQQLGAGAMGVVYRAKHIETGQGVALKVIAPAFSTDELLVARFEREMTIVQRLEHPNIVRCFGAGGEGKQRYFVMELVEGGSVASVLEKRGRISWQETIRYTLQASAALEHANQFGIIHRDIKPANLLLAKDGTLKLGDFGLALDPQSTALTAAGRTVGTVNYMAPEQIRGKPPVSHQTDLYALGCVMFEMLTGRPPFPSEATAEVLYQHLEKKPQRVSAIALDCPPLLDLLIGQLLEKDALQRPADARNLARMLREIEQRAATAVSSPDQVSNAAYSKSQSKLSAVEPLVRDKAKKRSRKLWFYQKPWFALACLVIVIVAVIWAVRSRNDHQHFVRSKALWVRALADPNVSVRSVAARSLGELGPAAEDSLPALTTALDDENTAVRIEAIHAIAKVGPDAGAAVPALTKISRTDENDLVRKQAQDALARIRAGDDSNAQPTIYITTATLAILVLGGIAWARWKLGPTAVPSLIEDLKDDDGAVRRRAIRILGMIGSPAKAAVPALIQALKERDPSIRRAAERALGRIGIKNKTAIPDLMVALKDRDPFVRARAAVLLGKIGPAAKAAIPALIEVLKDSHDLVRIEAVETLGRIDVEAELSASHLTEAMHDKSYSVRQAAATALKKLQITRGNR